MFFWSRLRLALIAVVATGVAGCTMLYPRFDSLLNPDIANPNVGEIAESVRCAVLDFYVQRATQIRAKAETELHKALEGAAAKKRAQAVRKDVAEALRDATYDDAFCKDETAWRRPKWRIAIYAGTDTAPQNYKWRPFKGQLKNGKLNNDVLKFGGKPYFGVYKYIEFDKEGNQCLPAGGCPPGTQRQTAQKKPPEHGGLVLTQDEPDKPQAAKFQAAQCVPKENRFALDPTGKAKIELSLQATNTGSMNYQKIDASNWHNYFIVPGGSANPFPMLKISDKQTNKVEITLTMPQANNIAEEPPKDGPDVDPEFRKLVNELRRLAEEKERPRISSPLYSDRIAIDLKQHEKTRKEVIAEIGDYEKCSASRIDFLGLSGYVSNIVSEQEGNDHKVMPVGLDSLVLTAQFQITLDASAGTQHLLRIVPVVQAPVLSLTPDHTHSLKITFAGKKGRGFDNFGKSLAERCQERFRGLLLEPAKLTKEKVDEVCYDPRTILIESLIEAVDNSKAGASSN